MQAAYELTFALFAVYYVVGHRLWGQTLGKRLFRLRIQGTTRAVSVPGLLLRFVVKFWGPIAAMVMLHLQPGLALGGRRHPDGQGARQRACSAGRRSPSSTPNVEDLLALLSGAQPGAGHPLDGRAAVRVLRRQPPGPARPVRPHPGRLLHAQSARRPAAARRALTRSAGRAGCSDSAALRDRAPPVSPAPVSRWSPPTAWSPTLLAAAPARRPAGPVPAHVPGRDGARSAGTPATSCW